MSTLSCTFCTHPNPEGSKFCNECGSPLHLAPCPHCQAVNDVSAARCFQCGAALATPPPGEAAAGDDGPADATSTDVASGDAAASGSNAPASPVEVSPRGDSATTDALGNPLASVPAALAEHFVAFEPKQAAGTLLEPIRADAHDRLVIEPPAHRSKNPPRLRRWDSGARSRAYGIVGGISIACLGGALAWAWLNPFPRSEATVIAPTVPSTVAAPADAPAPSLAQGAPSTPAVPSAAGVAPEATVASAATAAPDVTVGSPAGADSTSTAAATPDATAVQDGAPATARAARAGSDVLATIGPIDDPAPPAALDPLPALEALPGLDPLPSRFDRPRAVAAERAPARSREQAERDALATQRLIARDLAEFQREDRRYPSSRP